MNKYEDLCISENDALKTMSERQNYENFSCLIDEKAGGVDIYIHEEIIYQFCCFLVWEHPTTNKHIKDVDHVDYEGWSSLGWDIDMSTDMQENSILNKAETTNYQNIFLNGVVVGKLVNLNEKDKYINLLKEWSEKYLK